MIPIKLTFLNSKIKMIKNKNKTSKNDNIYKIN